MRFIKTFISILFLLNHDLVYSQCGPSTPTFSVNLTGNPSGTWLSPNIVRNDQCCGQTGVVCVKFVITLDPMAAGITFTFASGAVPSGALNYQIGCGPQTAVGQPICLSGVGPHILTFCKPGNNPNTYAITSIPKAVGGSDITINDGCTKTFSVSGFNPTTVSWTSISPGAQGAYNNYLSCTNGCLNPSVTPTPGSNPPAFIDYKICGQPAAQCNFATTCDTVRVYLNPSLAVNIIPQNPTICFGQTSTTLSAIGSGGTPPYNYLWNNVNPSQTINVGVGNYNVKLSDNSGCPPVYNSVSVTAFSVAISANAGPNQTRCSQSPLATLNATVTGASGGIWSGGNGTFLPTNTTLANLTYSPTAAEIANGFVNLILTTTGNGTCPSKTDTVRINYQGFTGTPVFTPTNVSCFGGNNGAAQISVTGGVANHTYTWTVVPTNTTNTISNLSVGNYSVAIRDGIGCTTTTFVTITQPTILAVSSGINNNPCFGSSAGTIGLTASGGTPGYTYSWSPSGQTTPTVTSLAAGNYTTIVRDARGCINTSTYVITQPTALSVNITHTNVSCFAGNDGRATSSVTGGTSPYTYSWSPGGSTTQNVNNLTAGTYTLRVTDAQGCIISSTAQITQPTQLTSTTSITNETCNYLNNGTATVTASGGTPGYSYLWQPGGLTAQTINNLQSGNYTYTVTDTKNCISIGVVIIAEPLPLAVTISASSVSCFGGNNGSAIAYVSGGTPNYTYLWSSGGVTNPSINSVPIGNYTVTVTDNNSCLASNSVTITQPTPVLVTNTITNVSCFNGNNGTIAISPSGGTPGYTYFWIIAGQTTSSVSGLPAGNYSVNVTDANNCLQVLNYTINQPLPLSVVHTQTNVSCFGGSDGITTSSVSGGTAPYSYNWMPGSINTQNASGLSAGTYTLSITDALNCILTSTVTINEPPLLMASTSVTDETCDYLNNGTATASQNGGTPGYTYLWAHNGQTTNTVNNLASGTYSVTITDSKGCTSIATAVINQPAPIVITFTNQVNVSCFGGNDASVTSVASGGTPNYTYLWSSGGVTNPAINNIPVGNYTVTVTDNNSCVASNSVTIIQPTPVVVTNTITNVSCFNGSDGTIAITPSGGTPGYTYFWIIAGQTTSSVTGLPAGNFSVNVTDANNCLQTLNYTVTQPLPLSVIHTQTNVSCFGGSDGIATSNVSGGTAPYSYNWMPGSISTQNASGLSAGTYTLTITDALNCTLASAVTISEPPLLVASTSITDETCDYSDNGTATASQTGGTPGYTYLWAHNGQPTITVNNLASGTYSVIVTDSKGCTSIATAVINQPAPMVITFTNQVNVSCFGGSNASIGSIISGGTPNYNYSWSPGGSSNNSIFNISVGTYSLTITDNNSCIAINTLSITQPTAPVSIAVSSNSTTCFDGTDGSALANASGGTPGYTYTWTPGVVTSNNITNIPSGTYTINATDIMGCLATNTVTVAQPPPILPVTTATASTCGNPNGIGAVSVSGGIGPFTFQWIPQGGTNSITTGTPGIPAGVYSVVVTDANGCSVEEDLLMNDLTGPSVTIYSVTNVSCYGFADGSALANVTGGFGALTYSWSPYGGNGLIATGLLAGTYYLTATDANGCISSAVTDPTVTQPPPLTDVVMTSSVLCFGGATGSATVSAVGGTPNYSYTWLPSLTSGDNISNLSAGIYSVQTIDNNNCSYTSTFSIVQPTAAVSAITSSTLTLCFGSSDGSASVSASGGTFPYIYNWFPGNIAGQTITNIPAGTYTSVVTDINSCSTTSTVFVNQLSQVTLSSTSINSDCGAANGQASVNASGGTGAYTYTWSPSGGNNANANGLLANTYTVLVSDANGCSTSTTQIVGDNPGPSVIVASTTSVSCFGGNNATATASVSGGTGPFTYTWSPSGGNTVTATGLTTGIYTVSITSTNGCLASAISPNINEPSQVLAIVSTSNVSCFAGANGTASVTAFGGNAGYTYTWMPSNTTGANVGGLTAGNYSVQIADVNNCSIINTYSISQPMVALSAVASASNVSCFSGSDGSVFVSAAGGTSPYSYTWTPGNINTTLMSNVTAGTYSALVNDINGCVTSATVQVTQPTQVSLSSTSIYSDCGAANGQASVNASGGTGAYSFTWSPSGGNNANANGLLANTYTVLVSDANGCSTSTTQIVGDNPGPSVIVASTTSVSCFGGNNATATASVSGGTGPFTYTWSPSGGNTITATGLTTGIYTVSITSANGCLASAISPNINEPSQVLAIVSTSDVSCFAGANGSASVTAFGGNAGYTYTWMPSNTTGANVGGLTAGNYSVQIADVNNCSIINTYSISQPVAALSAITTASNVSCFGGNNGIANVIASGGTPPYSYTWSPMSISSQTVGSLSNGTYTVNVSDSKNCLTSATVQITQPTAPLTATAISAATSCSGGSDGTATVTPIGGTFGYTYSWTPSGGNNANASGLIQGNYFVTVTDANGCQTNVAVIISSPSAITGSLIVVDAACNLNNGSIISQISGGTGPYNYTWTPGNLNTSGISLIPTGNYSLLVNDFLGCPLTLTATVGNIPGQTVTVNTPTHVSCFGGNNGIGSISVNQGTPPYSVNWAPYGGNTLTASGLSPGTYTVTVTDSRGCNNSANINIIEPSQLSVAAGTISNVTCFGLSDGSITVNPSGGTPGYSYTWSPTENTSTLTNLAAGTYTVRVADSFSCSTILSIDVTQPQSILINISNATNPTCFNGSNGAASASTTGGISPYSYTWSSSPQQFGSSANNLPAGIYSVTVTDLNNCVVTNTVSIVNPPEVITIAGANDTICLGLSGGVSASANGGAGNHYFAWQPGGIINNGSLPINPALATTIYTVVAYDQLGCAGNPDTVRAVVYSLTAVNIDAIGITPICPGQGTTIYAETTGNTGPLNFSWNNNLGNGPGAFVVIPQQPTTYVVSVSNSCGQTISDSVQILFNPQPTIVAFPNGTISCIPTPISFTDNSITGNPNDPITGWSWNFGDGNTSNLPNPTHLYTTPGTYTITLTVSTDGGCINSNATNPITIIAAPYPIAAFTTNGNIFNLPYETLICTNTSTGAVTYYWEFGDGNTSTAINPQHLYGSVGFFDILLVATNQYGCSDTATTKIKTDADLVFPNAFTPNSDGPSGGFYTPGSLDNDIFFPYSSGVVEYKLQIFNRWGELIFETEDFKQGWDGYYRGKLCQLGVYVWKAYAKLNNGVIFNKTGDVTLLR